MRFRSTIGLLFFALFATASRADSWMPPEVRSYLSSDGTWKLTIYPRGIESPLAYFEDKVAGKSNAGGIPGDTQKSPIAQMQHAPNGKWQTVWKIPLVNEVSPVDAVVSNRGVSVTFDNWHSVGYGDDAVVLYSADGEPIRQFGLSAFLPKYYVDSLPHSVSSIQWRGDPRVDEARGEIVVPVVVPTAEEQGADTGKTGYVDVRFTLKDGSLAAMTGNAWREALASASKADARRMQLQEEEKARFVSPLAAPQGNDTRDWHQYLVAAFFRLEAGARDSYPATEVIPLKSDRQFALMKRYLGEALTAKMNAEGAIMVASPSQDVLVSTLSSEAKRVKAGSLAQARIYVAADAGHMPTIRSALAHTGAKVVQIDIDSVIPQRKDRLERYLRQDESE